MSSSPPTLQTRYLVLCSLLQGTTQGGGRCLGFLGRLLQEGLHDLCPTSGINPRDLRLSFHMLKFFKYGFFFGLGLVGLVSCL